jgi:hypothetical protein
MNAEYHPSENISTLSLYDRVSVVECITGVITMGNLKSAVITAYGHDKVIDKIAVKLFDKSGTEHSYDDSKAITYCDTINSPESQEEAWAFAKIVSENTQYSINEFLPLKFDILLIMDNVSIQRVLMEVDNNELAKALKGANEKIQREIFNNMSERAVQILKEEMEYMGPVRLKDIIDAQEKILKIIIDLDKHGGLNSVIRKYRGEIIGREEIIYLWMEDEYLGHPEKLKTTELCLEAVKQNSYALEHVPDEHKTAEVCFEAVKQDGYALKFVPGEHKTAELCLIAVKGNGMALESVPSKLKTMELYLEAVKENGRALQFVPNKLIAQVKASFYNKGGTTK